MTIIMTSSLMRIMLLELLSMTSWPTLVVSIKNMVQLTNGLKSILGIIFLIRKHGISLEKAVVII